MQQQPTFNFGLAKIFFYLPHTQYAAKTKNYRNQGSNAKKFLVFLKFPSHIPRWVCFVQKTRAKNSHAWAPLKCKKGKNARHHRKVKQTKED
jgi:hypothetical protein